MILISEVVHNGEVHLMVNQCFLQIFKAIYPKERIVFRSEDEHSAAIKGSIVSPVAIEYLSFNKYYETKEFSWFGRIFGEIKQIIQSLRLGKKLKANTYVWTCLFPTGHLFLTVLSFFYNRKVKHIIILHGELELLKTLNRRKSEMFLGVFLRLAINFSRKDTKYIVLGDRIKMHLKKYISVCPYKRTLSILHPYVYGEAVNKENDPNIYVPVVFGAIGTQMLTKNSQYIFQLAKTFEERIIGQEISFVTIGKVLSELDVFKNKLVQHFHSNDFVPQTVFETEIQKLNFVIFFYDNSSYQLCASGAVFEVIKFGLPIISIYNDYFDWLFEKYGPMGFLCTDLSELESVIDEVLSGQLDDEINLILSNIKRFKLNNSLNSIAADLASQL